MTKEYAVAVNNPSEFFVLRRIGEVYLVIAQSGSRDYAEEIVQTLNTSNDARGSEIRRSWDDLAH